MANLRCGADVPGCTLTLEPLPPHMQPASNRSQYTNVPLELSQHYLERRQQDVELVLSALWSDSMLVVYGDVQCDCANAAPTKQPRF